ncbi:MAG: hypothetical protein V4717_15960 [Bacteroidota bacterium]
MKKILLLSVAATLICSLSFATIRRVGYPGTFRANVDYTTFQEAHDAASNNDTIQIYGNVGSGNVTKPLVILGFGYNFDVNTGLQVIGIDMPSNISLSFHEGSNGSIVTGLAGNFSINPWDPTSNIGGAGVSNITFNRCILNIYLNNYSVGSIGLDGGPISNIKIYSSVIHSLGMYASDPTAKPITNLQVYNCIIRTATLHKAGTSAAFINCSGPTQVGGYTYPYLTLNDAGCLIKNCILFVSNAAANVNTIYENNFFAEEQPLIIVPGGNNRWSQDWGLIFNRLGGTSDNPSVFELAEFDEDYFVLKAGSPAINGGFNAASQPTNCGIYGGEAAYIYKLSGVPAVPAIYQLNAPSLNTGPNPYNVTISVRSNN